MPFAQVYFIGFGTNTTLACFSQNLHIKEAGEDYTLRFIARKANGELIADIYSEPFDVAIGVPYKLAFQTHVGTSFGGQTFANSPAVALVDRGGNIVTESDAYLDVEEPEARFIKAVLTKCPWPNLCPTPAATAALLQPTANTAASISEGVATFQDLYLNVSGYPYQITFHSTLVRVSSCPGL